MLCLIGFLVTMFWSVTKFNEFNVKSYYFTLYWKYGQAESLYHDFSTLYVIKLCIPALIYFVYVFPTMIDMSLN